MPIPRGFSHGEDVAKCARSQRRLCQNSVQEERAKTRGSLSWLARLGRKHGSSFRQGNTDKSWLQEAEDERWMEVEGGSPKRWRSCSACAFLNPAHQPYCEGCGRPAKDLSFDNQIVKDGDILRSMAHADTGNEPATTVVGIVVEDNLVKHSEVIDGVVVENTVIGRKGSGLQQPTACHGTVRAASRSTGNSDEETDADSDEAGYLQIRVVKDHDVCQSQRHNRILTIFRALDSQSTQRLGRDALHMFLKLRGSPIVVGNRWPMAYRALMTQSNWDVKGITLMQFIRFVDDENSCGHCSDGKLQEVITKLEELSTEDQNESEEEEEQPGEEKEREKDQAADEQEEDDEEDCDEEDIDEENLVDNLETAPPVGTMVEVLCRRGWLSACVINANGVKMTVRFEATEDEDEEEDVVSCSDHCIRLLDRTEAANEGHEGSSSQSQNQTETELVEHKEDELNHTECDDVGGKEEDEGNSEEDESDEEEDEEEDEECGENIKEEDKEMQDEESTAAASDSICDWQTEEAGHKAFKSSQEGDGVFSEVEFEEESDAEQW